MLKLFVFVVNGIIPMIEKPLTETAAGNGERFGFCQSKDFPVFFFVLPVKILKSYVSRKVILVRILCNYGVLKEDNQSISGVFSPGFGLCRLYR